MANSPVDRRLLLTGGFGVGGAVLLTAAGCGNRTHAHEPPAGPVTGAGSDSAPASTPASPSPIATPTHTSPLSKAELTAKLAAYQRSRGTTLGIALADRRTRVTFSFQGGWRNETLSIVKVLVLATVLRHCQERGITLSREQSTQAFTMITRSDNEATNALLTWVGADNVRRVAQLAGLTGTVIQSSTKDGEGDWWGYSTTTALDQLRVLANIVHGTRVITAANRDYLVQLMSQVIPAQRWGVCTPPLPTSVRWTTKNGWGERDGGYRANSIGHISGNGRDYDAVVLSRSPHDRDYARATVSGAAQILYDALAHPLR